jgi:ketosteroid isomerase-like protein
MPRGTLETVRETLAAFDRQDLEAMVALSDPEIEIEVEDMPESESFRGHDGVREFCELNWEPFETFSLEVDGLIEHGPDEVVILTCIRARGKGSGVELAQKRSGIVTVRDGRVVRGRYYAQRKTALEVAGLGDEPSDA